MIAQPPLIDQLDLDRMIPRVTVSLVVLAAASVLMESSPMLEVVFSSLVIMLLTMSSVTDLIEKRIPNVLTYSAILAAFGIGLLCQTTSVQDALVIPTLSDSFYGCLVCFSLMLAMYSAGSVGAGDVKLAAAIGALVGLRDGVNALAWAHVIAGSFCLIRATVQLGFANVWEAGRYLFGRAIAVVLPNRIVPMRPDFSNSIGLSNIPMAPAFAIGTVVSLSGASIL